MNKHNCCEITIGHTKGARTNLLAKPIPCHHQQGDRVGEWDFLP